MNYGSIMKRQHKPLRY